MPEQTNNTGKKPEKSAFTFTDHSVWQARAGKAEEFVEPVRPAVMAAKPQIVTDQLIPASDRIRLTLHCARMVIEFLHHNINRSCAKLYAASRIILFKCVD